MDSLGSMGCDWYNVGFFFNVFIVSMVVFIVLFKVSCVCTVPRVKRHKSVARSSFDKKPCTTSIFGMCKCLCEDLEFPAHQNVAIYTQLL